MTKHRINYLCNSPHWSSSENAQQKTADRTINKRFLNFRNASAWVETIQLILACGSQSNSWSLLYTDGGDRLARRMDGLAVGTFVLLGNMEVAVHLNNSH